MLILAFACVPPSFQREGELQWGTKVLRHFCKVTPFSTVNMYLSPPPVFHHPLSLKSRWYFRPSSLSFTSDNIDSGVGRLMTFKKNEIINELKKLLIKAPILNKCVNYFCPWKYESMFSSLSFDAAEFRHDEVSLVWAKLFVYKQKICTFSSWFLVYINKSEIIWIIKDHPFINSNFGCNNYCCNQNFVRKTNIQSLEQYW